jgi:hypothetical protein
VIKTQFSKLQAGILPSNPQNCECVMLFCSFPDPWHFGTAPDPHLWLTDPAPDPVSFRQVTKTKKIFSYYLLKVQVHHSLKIQSYCFTNEWTQRFFLLVWLDDRRIRIRTSNGPGRPKNERFLRIRNTALLWRWRNVESLASGALWCSCKPCYDLSLSRYYIIPE